MNIVMKEFLNKETDKFDKQLMEGVAIPYVDKIAEHLDAIIKSAISTLSEDINLTYKGWRKLTPREDYFNNINSSMSKNIIDISTNYLTKIEFGFKYNDIEINRVIALPYVERGGVLRLSDAYYNVVPVLSEYPISPAPGELFIRLLRDKLNIKKMDRNILINDIKTPKQILFSKSYKLLKNVNEVIPVTLYMFVKYGFFGVFKKYFNTEPLIFTDPNINTASLREEYSEYTTVGMKPKNLQAPIYAPHSVKILIKKDAITPFLEIVVSSLIYSFDMTPQFAMNLKKVAGKKTEPNTYFTTDDIDDESLFWISLLGKIVFKNKFSMDRIQVDMFEHIDILNGYMDTIIKDKLKEAGIVIEDFYDLTAWVMENFHELVMNYEKYSSSLENRYIEILYYLLFDLIVGINKAFLEFKRTASRKTMTEKETSRLFNKYMSSKKIFSLTSSVNGTSIALSPIDSSGDSLVWKMTSILEDQNRANGVRRSVRNVLPPNTRTLRAEDLAFGSMLYLSKKSPTPRLKVNPYVSVDVETGKIKLDDDVKRCVEKLDILLQHKFEDSEISESEIIGEVDKE